MSSDQPRPPLFYQLFSTTYASLQVNDRGPGYVVSLPAVWFNFALKLDPRLVFEQRCCVGPIGLSVYWGTHSSQQGQRLYLHHGFTERQRTWRGLKWDLEKLLGMVEVRESRLQGPGYRYYQTAKLLGDI